MAKVDTSKLNYAKVSMMLLCVCNAAFVFFFLKDVVRDMGLDGVLHASAMVVTLLLSWVPVVNSGVLIAHLLDSGAGDIMALAGAALPSVAYVFLAVCCYDKLLKPSQI